MRTLTLSCLVLCSALASAQQTSLAVGPGGVLIPSGRYWDASQLTYEPNCSPGPNGEVDGCLNGANALALTTGVAVIDARGLSLSQSLVGEVDIGRLQPPALSTGTGGSLSNVPYYVVYCLLSAAFQDCPGTSGANLNLVSWVSTVTPPASGTITVSPPTYYGSATQWAIAVGTANSVDSTKTGHFVYCSSANPITSGITISSLGGCSSVIPSVNATGDTATLIPPHNGVWTMKASGGNWCGYGGSCTQTAQGTCGLRFFTQSSYLGDASGEGRSFSVQGGGVTALATVCTDTMTTDNVGPDPNGFYRLEGLSGIAESGDTMSTAVYIFGTVDTSSFPYLHGAVHTAIPALIAQDTCCGSTFPHAQLEGNGFASPAVLEVGGTSLANSGNAGTEITCDGCSIVHPASSAASIQFAGNDSAVSFLGTTYLELTTSSTSSDQILVASSANEVGGFVFDTVRVGGNTSGGSQYVFHVGTHNLNGLRVGSITAGLFTNCLNYLPNTALNVTVPSTQKTCTGFTIPGSSPLSVLGSTALGGQLNQIAGKSFAGTCTMATASTCTFTLGGGSFSSTPICIATVQSPSPTTYNATCAISGTTVTITAAASNSNTWAATLIGNPN